MTWKELVIFVDNGEIWLLAHGLRRRSKRLGAYYVENF